MEEKYWKQFTESGKVSDYLNYRGMAICGSVMRRYQGGTDPKTGEMQCESDNPDGDGFVGRSHR